MLIECLRTPAVGAVVLRTVLLEIGGLQLLVELAVDVFKGYLEVLFFEGIEVLDEVDQVVLDVLGNFATYSYNLDEALTNYLRAHRTHQRMTHCFSVPPSS